MWMKQWVSQFVILIIYQSPSSWKSVGYSVNLVGLLLSQNILPLSQPSFWFGSLTFGQQIYLSCILSVSLLVIQSVSHEEVNVNVSMLKIKSRSYLLAPVPATVPVCWKIPATKCTEPGPIFIKYGQTSITNGAQLTFLVPFLKAIETRVCVGLHLPSSVWTVGVPWGKYMEMKKEPAV